MLTQFSDFADLYPGAEVIGVDISPSQPQWIPPNLRFEIDDVTQPWTYGRNSFDYIHMRWLVGAIEDWDKLFRECFNALQPGGYLESKESSAVIQSDDGTVADDSALAQWGKVFKEAGTKSGKSFQVVEEGLQRKAMEAAGFVDIEERDMKVCIDGSCGQPLLTNHFDYRRRLEPGQQTTRIERLGNIISWLLLKILKVRIPASFRVTILLHDTYLIHRILGTHVESGIGMGH